MARDAMERSRFTRRTLIIGGAQTLVFGGLVARLYDLQVIEHPHYRKQARDNAIAQRPLVPERGLITDRTGALLAGNRQHWRALFLLTDAHDPQGVIARFAELMALSPVEQARLEAVIAGPAQYVPVVLKHDLDWEEMARLEVHATQLPGVIIDRGFSRFYPLGADAAHTVGYVVRPNAAEAAQNPVLALPGARVGGSGIEQARDAVLLGAPGVVETEVDALGSVVRVLDRDAGQQGKIVSLTLDTVLQRAAVTALAGRVGATVLLDAQDGAVLAMASAPSFDPAWFDQGVPDAVWSRWMKNPERPLTNRTTQGLYAPGSSFKPTVALAALRCGAITAETRFFCPGYLKIGDRMFYCWLRSGHGSMDAASALQQSCDVFYYHVAMRTGIDRMAAMGDRLGLTGPPHLDFPDLAAGFLPTRDWAWQRRINWTEGDTAVEGIGQGYTLFTPLNMATMIARVATGQAIVPHLVRAVGEAMAARPTPGGLRLDDEHLAVVRRGLDEVVNTPAGTSWGARLMLPGGVRMAGKTGTAQVINEDAAMEAANYNDARLPWKFRPNALFVGYAPVDKPRFAAAVVIEHGTLLGPVKVARDVFTAAFGQDLAVG
ncbi:MAG: penicillin-binding protein 2 [Acidiphilium sp.]|nr:penicillin-binding protein 2 [Acidiphilium sp.]MDD4936035.1 penicillin-binding protein 2 [Acidiphilium sp.]